MTDRPRPTFLRGTRFGEGGRYEIRRRIGVGGMAEVYKAVDTRLGRRAVAIKMLSAAVADHPFAARLRTLFIGEAQALSRISDDNVVNVSDFGIENGTPYMVMEYLRGMDLGAFLKAAKRLPVQEAVDLMLAICSGVYACHLAGIIHRDLKPANVFLCETPQGRQPTVIDFGVARVPVPSDAQAPRTDLVVGTPHYMSPEQAAGKPANELSDQYSIGAVLHRCIYGRVPESARTSAQSHRVDLVAGLHEVILRALDPSPAKRFPSVHALGQALLPFASQPAQARWRSYYHEAPVRFDPNTTGSIAFAREPIERLSQAVTIAVDPSPASELAGPTIIEGPPSMAEEGLTAATAIDAVSRRPTESITGVLRSGAVGPRRGGWLGANRDRAKILGGAFLLAVLIVAVSALAGRHLRQPVEHRPLLAPTVQSLDEGPKGPSTVPPVIGVAPRAIPSKQDHPADGTATRSNSVRSTDVIPSATPARPVHRARRHRQQVPPPSIEYGSDGLPILH